MKTFNYMPKNPVRSRLYAIAMSLLMIFLPIFHPFGIRVGQFKILPASVVTVLLIVGGAYLLYEAIKDLMKERALVNSGGGTITVDGNDVSYPVVSKKSIIYEKFNISDIQFVKYDESADEFEIAMFDSRVKLDVECFDNMEKFEEFRTLLGK